ncbi:MAG TPA: SMP-30/gluconolactonase/LRE family protein [Smithellaceae bacterium]|nr:SMP-30/gluconolactonase/LRE family protein [Smithellaceae bacterium]
MKKIIMVVCAVVVLMGALLVKTLWNAGEFKRIEPFSLYSFVAVPGFPGTEDIDIDRGAGVALGSFTDRRAAIAGQKRPYSGILAYDLTAPGSKPVLLKTDFPGHLTPHGINLYHGSDGSKRLFVINMGEDSHFFETTGVCTVEIFSYQDGRLHHLETVKSPELTTPNDILGVGPRRFYVTIDHGWTSKWGKMLENYLQLPVSYVLYYDGAQFRKVATGIGYANGIALSPDGGTVYVGATVGRKIHVYSRNIQTGDLAEQGSIELNTGVDNLDVHPDGSIWAACHSKLLSFVAHSKDAANLSPSEVVRVLPLKNGGYEVVRVYQNDGKELSGASVAASWKNRLLIGAIYENHFLDGALLPGKSLEDARR